MENSTMKYGMLVAGILAFSTQSAFAQTVGNGTVIAPSSIVIGPSAGQREFASMNTNSNGSSQDTGVGAYATRHYSRGETSGIGGSFIGTASPTSESSPAVIINPAPRNNTPQFRLPSLESSFGSTTSTPAMGTYNPALPQIPRLGTITNPFEPLSSTPEFTHTGVEPLPSFNTQPSFMQKAQFDQFSTHW